MKYAPRKATILYSRHIVLWLTLLLFFISAIWRLTTLHVFESKFLQEEGSMRSIRAETIHARRGMILDRFGEPLAVSSPVKSIWINPKVFKADKKAVRKIAKILNVSPKRIHKKLKSNQNKTFAYLKRHISPQLGKKIARLDLDGIYTQTEYRRYYPHSEISAHIVGTTNLDQNGIQGLELAYNDWLKGVSAKNTVLRDRTGKLVETISEIKKPSEGKNLQLSLDSRLQYRAFTELLKTVKKYKAKSGSVVALNVKTGEVLAMVNYPSYNPNKRFTIIDDRFRNRAVTDQFEPGSTIKPFSMVNLISSGEFYPHTAVDTNPGILRVGGKTIKDVRNYGRIDLNTVIKKSSNVGISKLTLSLPPQSLYQTFQNFGFGQVTRSGFPGESAGILSQKYDPKPIELATLSFGYGLTVTPLQLASGYATLASNCKKREVTFIKASGETNYHQVCQPAVANSVNKMLQLVIGPGGTGTRANVPGYHAAGKTGTVRKVSETGYADNSHMAMFAGFAPIEDPAVALVVVIDEPSTGKYYGGQVAAPLFSRVMYNALQRLEVPTNKMQPKVILAQK